MQKLNAPPALDEPRAVFYNFALLMLTAISGGLMAAGWCAYVRLNQISPELGPVFLAFSVVPFFISAIVGIGFSNYFSKFLPWVRVQRKREIELAITTIKMKIAKVDETD